MSFQPQADTLTYEPFFGLSEKPFSLNADPRFVYESPTYVATCDSLLAGIRRREGLLVLTGEIGTGKTTLCRAVLRNLGRKTYSSLVPDPFASREDLLKMLLVDFGVLSIPELTAGSLRQASRTELGYLLGEFLESTAKDAFVLVIIDEAQNLSGPLIEETRILSDTFGAEGRLQIVFVGQPELHAKLKLPEMRQVDQRVCGYHRLAPMSRDAVAGYIQHRLQVAGGRCERVLFPPAIVDGLYRRSGGVPRLINRICDRALHLAYQRQAESVNREILDTALIEVGADTLSPTWDSIIFGEPSTLLPAAAPTPTPTPAEAPTPATAPAAHTPAMMPSIGDDENFRQQVDRWAAQELAPRSRRRLSSEAAYDAPRRPVKTDWPRDLRSETYLNRLWRMWAKRAAIAVAVLMAINALILVSSMLPGTSAPPALAPLPEAPARAVPGLALPQAPPAAAPVAAAPAAPVAAAPVTAASVTASREYFVAVGLFASRDRADQLVDALTQAGLPAMQRPVQFRRQLVQQIVLGPFFSRSDAVADLRRLQALGGYGDATVIDSMREPSEQ